ncbi:MAG: response regulator [Magnetococcales bacterium]|nr:response regulator [Magnetococcales bacterium]
MKQGGFTRGITHGFAFLVGTMLVLGGMNALVMTRITGWMDHLVDLEERDVQQGRDILYDLGVMHRTLKNLIISPDPRIMQHYTEVLVGVDRKILAGIDRLARSVRPEETALLAQFRTAYEQYTEIQGRVLHLAKQHSDQRAAQVSRQGAEQALDLALAEIDRLTGGAGDGLAQVRALERTLLLLQRAEKNALLSQGDAEFDRIGQEMESLETRLAQLIRTRRQGALSAEQVTLDALENRIQDYGLSCRQVLSLARQNSQTLAFELSIGEGRHRLDEAERVMHAILGNIDQEVAALRQQTRTWAWWTFLAEAVVTILTTLGSIATAIVLLRGLTGRVRALSDRAAAIAQGVIPAGMGSRPRDELTAMDDSLEAIVISYKQIAGIASRMAEGEHPDKLPERSPDDLLIRSINRMIEKSESVVAQVQAVAQGQFPQVTEPVSGRDVLGLSLARMTATLRRMDRERRHRLWLEEGYGRLNEMMREELSLPDLATRIVTFLCRYLELPGGILHLVGEGGLQALGSCLLQDQDPGDASVPGSGLASQAARTGVPGLLSGIRDHRWQIATGFGTLRPEAILAFPLLARNECRGVLELASLADFSEDCMAFLGRVSASIAITLEKARFDERMRQALQYKSAFMAAMSHEIRTPMNGILGTVQLLEQTPLTREQQAHLAILDRSARALLTLLNDLLDLSRIESGKLQLREEVFALRPLLDDVISLFQPRALEKRLDLRLTLNQALPAAVGGDAGRLRQILLNLVGNAVKFTAAGRVELKVVAPEISESGAAGRWRFEVQDTGIGIDPGELVRLFQPFVQAESVRQRHFGGTGLGLSICQGLVAAMGGVIGVESQPNAGSRFWFEIPLTLVQLSASSTAEGEPPLIVSLQGLEVLVVEDEATNRHVALGLLRQLGCRPRVADNGGEALRLFREHPVGVVLLDMQLPDLDGLEVARRLRDLAAEQARPLALVAMTALTMPGDLERYRAARLDGFVAKPILLTDLARELVRLTAVPEDPDPVLDPAPLTRYRQDLAPVQVARILDACRGTLHQGMEELTQAVRDGDSRRIGRIAHRLKSAAGANGLVRLGRLAAAVEQAASSGSPPDWATLVAGLRAAADQALRELDRWQAEVSLPPARPDDTPPPARSG